MTNTVLQVALGGALGSVLRLLVGTAWLRAAGPLPLPAATLTVNVVGSAAMGAFVVLAAQRDLMFLSPFVMTGLLGGFTTFSAFSLESVGLLERGEAGLAALYIGLSVALSLTGLWLGMIVARAVA
ncbi:CrcB-like protein [Oceaniovalibus guishaninsula JLT2003]|uniref:Fluoride-specific ion channel FluC n=1 Tax=Oceaniovalibus guishaninsula JLT2003 TaxID=1231392 RepID=K2I3E6_9RHOB|nr:fluoride efflux transporter CrcB [Oceaniovalibus guishaninsula]EKE43425.1 CrcB-like protein [Oceaniovalibus guishaninsula JLT2003]